MTFRISGLDPAPFRALYGLSDDQLAANGARRYVVDKKGAFPERIELRDMEPGETALLLNYTHQPADTPYRASHAIFVREGAEEACIAMDNIPEVLRSRMLSLRAFDAQYFMVDADLVDGNEARGLIDRFLADPKVEYIQAHFARRGCYAARIDRG